MHILLFRYLSGGYGTCLDICLSSVVRAFDFKSRGCKLKFPSVHPFGQKCLLMNILFVTVAGKPWNMDIITLIRLSLTQIHGIFLSLGYKCIIAKSDKLYSWHTVLTLVCIK